MEFLSSLFLTITTFFGLGSEEVELPSVVFPVVETTIPEKIPASEIDMKKIVGDAQTGVTEKEKEDLSIDSEKTISTQPTANNQAINVQTMMVAGGCFWCVESDLEKVPGVIAVVSGYAGGNTTDPTYGNYIKGGHREVVEVTYDAFKVSFEDILIVTMKTTDPTDDDGSFADRGDYYSAAFYYETAEQKKIIDDLIKEVDEFGPYDKPLAIDVEKLPKFWQAEARHQDYYKGSLNKLKYQYYRTASGRDELIEKYWGKNDHSPELEWRNKPVNSTNKNYMWTNYVKPSPEVLQEQLDAVTFKVTQEEGTERSNTSPLDKNYEAGIYVDILSGEPLFSSRDKFDSGTGWPSFTRPITENSVTEQVDKKLFTSRTEIRSVISDNHLGHVFPDGPRDSTGLRYCMNGVSLKFIPKADMETVGYGDFIKYVE